LGYVGVECLANVPSGNCVQRNIQKISGEKLLYGVENGECPVKIRGGSLVNTHTHTHARRETDSFLTAALLAQLAKLKLIG